jgi:yeast amino acid transporter
MIIPYNSEKLILASDDKRVLNNASASPFVAAIKLAGIKVLPGFLNGCILLFVFSASNSDLYIASRTIYGLALQDKAPKILSRTDKR